MLEDLRKNHTSLSLDDIQKIDSTNLSHLDKHYLRLLLHCLELFKSIAEESSDGSLPSREIQLKWLRNLQTCKEDETFLQVLLDQLDVAAAELKRLAIHEQISPLELTIDHLISASQASKDLS